MIVEEWLGRDNKLGIDIFNMKYRHGDETFDEWLDRVSGGNARLRRLIIEKKFLPGGRILANRGLTERKNTYSNCYVISPPEDSIESIFECATKLARTYSYGGGCGIDISKLAPRGAVVNNAAKTTSGAVSFMDLYSLVTGLIGQDGRRGALMLSIDCHHPDLEEFIECKSDLNKVTNANISIRITDDFMCAVNADKPFDLTFTRESTGETITKTVNARDVFRKIAEMNWRSAEPGVLFWDRIRKWNLLSEVDEFEFAGVNPCAEEPLPAGGSCLLGSMNLSAYVVDPFTENARFDYVKFKADVTDAIHALNEIMREGLPLHPLAEQRDSVQEWKQIGLGIFGLADMLIKLGLEYGSNDAVDKCDVIGGIFATTAIRASHEEARECGDWVLGEDDIGSNAFYLDHMQTTVQLYNSQLLTIAPTGTLSTMIGVSGGIEPVFANSYTRRTQSLHGKDVEYKVYTPIVKEYMDKFGITDEADLPDYFVTAEQIHYLNRIKMQAAWQNHIDASISSTVNLPNSATVDDIMDLYEQAWRHGLKGITVYRSGCERAGILTADEKPKVVEEEHHQCDMPRGVIEDVPEWLTYRKYKIKTGCGKLYLFVGMDENDGRIYDFFTNTDGVGGCTVSTQANSRLMSAALRGGIPIEYIIEQLHKAGSCPSFQYARGKGVDVSKGRSCPSAIAHVLQSIIDGLELDEDTDEVVVIEQEEEHAASVDGGKCPECGASEVVHEGGCLTCKSCGWSKCS